MRVAAITFLLITLTFTLAHAHTDLTPAEVKAMLDTGGDLVVLDVREGSEYCDSTYQPPGHITGAINMPWNSGYLQAHYGEFSADDTTIVVCRSGARSNAAANFLDGAGFTNVFDMLGGMNAWDRETEICVAASIAGSEEVVPSTLFLAGASPNPFRLETEIAYAIPAAQGPQPVSLSIYDSRGRLVTTLVDRDQGPGIYHVAWGGTDSRGRPAASGVYFYKLTWSGQSKTARMVLLR
jgi:rhodanese-related sulfurtransferase